MKRRTLLRASAAAVGGGAATAAGLAVADDAGAQTARQLSVTGDDAALGTNASVTAVRLNVDVDWQYDLPDSTTPDTVVVELAAGTDELQVVATAESAELFTEASGSESFAVELVSEGVLSASALAPGAGGEQATDVTIEARLRVLRGETVLAREASRDTATLTVTREGLNASAYGQVGGSGSLTIETSDE